LYLKFNNGKLKFVRGECEVGVKVWLEMSDSENLADGLAISDVKRRVAYISSLECIQKCDCLPKVKGRVVYI